MSEHEQPAEVAEGSVHLGDDGSVTVGAPAAVAGIHAHGPVPRLLADDLEGDESS